MFKLCPSSTLSYILATCGFFFLLVSNYKHDSETQHSRYIMKYLLVSHLYGRSENFKTEFTGV